MKYIVCSKATPVENKVGGAKLPEGFWDGVEVWTYEHQHIRVSELRGEVKLMFKSYGNIVYLKTINYMMTTRPEGTLWKRANIDILLSANGQEKRLNSPDSMWQDGTVRPYEREMDIDVGQWMQANLKIRFEFDGKNNGVGERDSWGPLWLLWK
jgi:hypothetical protein